MAYKCDLENGQKEDWLWTKINGTDCQYVAVEFYCINNESRTAYSNDGRFYAWYTNSKGEQVVVWDAGSSDSSSAGGWNKNSPYVYDGHSVSYTYNSYNYTGAAQEDIYPYVTIGHDMYLLGDSATAYQTVLHCSLGGCGTSGSGKKGRSAWSGDITIWIPPAPFANFTFDAGSSGGYLSSGGYYDANGNFIMPSAIKNAQGSWTEKNFNTGLKIVVPGATHKSAYGGWEFLGWTTTKNGTTPELKAGDIITPSGDKNYYAIFRKTVPVTINYLYSGVNAYNIYMYNNQTSITVNLNSENSSSVNSYINTQFKKEINKILSTSGATLDHWTLGNYNNKTSTINVSNNKYNILIESNAYDKSKRLIFTPVYKFNIPILYYTGFFEGSFSVKKTTLWKTYNLVWYVERQSSTKLTWTKTNLIISDYPEETSENQIYLILNWFNYGSNTEYQPGDKVDIAKLTSNIFYAYTIYKQFQIFLYSMDNSYFTSYDSSASYTESDYGSSGKLVTFIIEYNTAKRAFPLLNLNLFNCYNTQYKSFRGWNTAMNYNAAKSLTSILKLNGKPYLNIAPLSNKLYTYNSTTQKLEIHLYAVYSENSIYGVNEKGKVVEMKPYVYVDGKFKDCEFWIYKENDQQWHLANTREY